MTLGMQFGDFKNGTSDFLFLLSKIFIWAQTNSAFCTSLFFPVSLAFIRCNNHNFFKFSIWRSSPTSHFWWNKYFLIPSVIVSVVTLAHFWVNISIKLLNAVVVVDSRRFRVIYQFPFCKLCPQKYFLQVLNPKQLIEVISCLLHWTFHNLNTGELRDNGFIFPFIMAIISF